MKKSTLSAFVAALLGTAVAGSANAFTLTSGNASVTGGSLGLSSWTVDGIDHLYEQNWWFNASSSAGSTPYNYELAYYSTPTETQIGSSSALVSYLNILGFDVAITYNLNGGAAGSGQSGLTENLTITNTTTSSGTFTLYQYTDFDLGGTASDYLNPNSNGNGIGGYAGGYDYGANDTITQVTGNYVTQTNGTMTASEQSGVVPFPTVTMVGQAVALDDALWDGTVASTLDGTTYTGDAAWIWGYTFNIQAGHSVVITKALALQAVPVPPAVWLFGSGLLGMVGIARRRA